MPRPIHDRTKFCFSRRMFLQGSAGLIGSQMLAGYGHADKQDESTMLHSQNILKTLPPLANYQPMVASAWIPRGEAENSKALFEKTLSAATDFSWLSRGDRVLIKLALNSGNPYPATV